jgi:hypothetical protein
MKLQNPESLENSNQNNLNKNKGAAIPNNKAIKNEPIKEIVQNPNSNYNNIDEK